MPSFDPIVVRKAVTEFAPLRPERFQELSAAKDFISELRQKRASYRSVADLLTRHGLPISKTAVAAFCHAVLGEPPRASKHRPRKRPPTPDSTNGSSPVLATPPPIPPAAENTSENPQNRARGPRIAQIRMLKPSIP